MLLDKTNLIVTAMAVIITIGMMDSNLVLLMPKRLEWG